jgi:transcription elongation factor SPT5
MAAPSNLTQTFDESEDEDNDFNPQPVGDSDEEKDRKDGKDNSPAKPSRSSSTPGAQLKEDSETVGTANGRIPASDRRVEQTQDEVDEDADGETDDEGGKYGRRNLNGGLEDDDDDDEEEEDDEDEDAVSVGPSSPY